MRYFYIITFDNQIFEISYTEEKLSASLNEWKNGGLLLLKELGGGLHASSISKILNEELYESYTYSVKPKLFIKDGTWYDGAERKIVRREKWKQQELDSKLKIENGEQHVDKEHVMDMIKKYTPELVKETRELADKFKV